ncbi:MULTISPECIES: hypothetical protein [unclassified Mycobacterium]|uniref:hypothetical protein n=1 Tax=unclassified Mycobacterium TaxID=2642494 RepID=UPI000B12D227|nr:MULTISPECIES: hypothetical protein [unclassified Mycobacterium]
MSQLDERMLRLALWCAEQELTARRKGDRPGGVLPWNAELVRALELELALSASGQDEGAELKCSLHDDEWIGTVEAAQILRWHERTLRRRASDLDGRKVAGKLVFQASTVRSYAEAMTDG